MGCVLDLLARGGLLHEKGPRPLVPRAAYQGRGRRLGDSVAPLGSLPRRRPQFGSVARWPRALPLRARAGVRDLGPVRAENLVHGSDKHGCSPGRPTVMIIDHVPAVRIPPDHMGCPVATAVPS